MRHRSFIAAAAVAALFAVAPAPAETDAGGREIPYSNPEFWKSGTIPETASVSGTQTYTLSAGPLDARARSSLSATGDIQVTHPWPTLLLLR